MAMQPSIEDFLDPYNQLRKILDVNDQNNTVLINLFSKLKSTYENIAMLFRSLGENFHKDISKDSLNERSYVYYQYLGNYLLKVSETNKEFSKKIYADVLLPYSEFSHQMDLKVRENLDKVEKVYRYRPLLRLYLSKAALKRHQENYYRLSKSTDKTQETFEKMVKNNKSEDQLLKAQAGEDKLLKAKMEAQEAGNLYRQQLKTTNQYWDALYATYEPVFNLYDELESNKASQVKTVVTQLVKHFNSFYSSDNQLLENPDEKLKEFDEKMTFKTNTLQLLSNPEFDEILKNKPMEEFLSFEAKKKIDELTIIKSVENDEYTVIYSASNEGDVQFIIDFTKLFQSNLSLAINNSEQSIELSIDQSADSPLMTDPSVRERILSDSQSSLKIPLAEDDEKKMWEVLKNPVNKKFLLDNLAKTREAFKNSKPVMLPLNAFIYLQNFLKKILDTILNEKDYDGLCSFLNVVLKYTATEGGTVRSLDKYFRSYEIWKNVDLWRDVVKTFSEKKSNDDSAKQRKAQEAEKANKQNQLMDKILNLSVKQFLEKPRPRATSYSDKEVNYSILHDVACYLARLTNSMEIASDILIQIAQELGFEADSIELLVNVLKKERNTVLREEIEEYKAYKKKKAEQKWGIFYHIYLALDFLEIRDLVKLLELNKTYRAYFKRRVYRTIFYNFSNSLTKKQRFAIWYQILGLQDMNIDYRKFIPEYENTTDLALKQAEEVINIDVIRSFKKHGEYDPEVLKDLLKGYAAFDKESSYCQGMNYMMGFFYLNTLDADLSFRYFVRLMEKHMGPMFDKDFKQLKIYFFKLNRILELYLPDLAEHFRTEKIDSSFYAPSWFITAFTSAYQYSPNSKLLEKIWDFFVLDGVKAIFKVTMLILKEYKADIKSLRFDIALNFLSELGKQELFTNVKYWEIKNGKCPVEEAPKEYRFVEDFEKRMKETHLTTELLRSFDEDFELFEKKLPKLAKPAAGSKEK